MSFIVVALAVVLRVAWVLAVPSKPVGDFAMYVESAAHLVEHGGFDSEYVFMPGYILLIAPIQALGGGWLATKLLGAVLGGLGTGAVMGIARRCGGKGEPRRGQSLALTAGLLYALWPAGIALSSVTGTDMPAAVLVTSAAYFLVRFAPTRTGLAAVLFGILTGFAATIRAIMMPLAALSFLVFRAQGNSWRKSAKSAALACLVALLVLSPWALRNRLRYGETFLTDSHGGLTALVGAYPNTEGCYSRSLNRSFHDVTGFALLAEPHREADRAALAIAKDWMAFDPLFTAGLLVSKTERLLVHERALLYWPIFRAGVLPDADRAFFERHRSAIEATADAFWLAVLACALVGCALSVARKDWLPLSLLPQVGALILLYAAIFSEPRYRLPIFMLLLPLAALGLWGVLDHLRGFAQRSPLPSWKKEAALAGLLLVLAFVGGPALAKTGTWLRQHHRWAASECQVGNQQQFCKWQTLRAEGTLDEASSVQGVWNGVGIALPRVRSGQAAKITVASEIPLAPGDYRIEATFDFAPLATASSTVSLSSDGNVLAPSISLSEIARASANKLPFVWNSMLHHTGNLLDLRVLVQGDSPAGPDRLWLTDLHVVPTSVPGSPPSSGR